MTQEWNDISRGKRK